MSSVSVIIPVFNTAAYLRRCLDSVLEGDFRDIEVICVDDCSTDASPDILDGYSARDPRVRIIRFSENRRVSAARNAAISAARGEYLYFLDSDDWLDPGYLGAMYSKAVETGQDVVVNTSWIKEYEDGRPGVKGEGLSEGFHSVETVQSLFYPTVWTRLFKASFISRHGLSFPEDICQGEDYIFASLAETLQDRSYSFKGPYYHYLQRAGSLNHTKNTGQIFNSLRLFGEWERRGISPEGKKIFYAGSLVIDSKETYDTLRDWFVRVEPYVDRHRELYVPFDLFCLEAVADTGSYEEFLSRFNPNLSVSFIREKRAVKPAVSVLIPVYNTAGELQECLDSVTGQTLSDIEVICIDDCSTDGSGAILDRAAAGDGRIRVIHFPENRGVFAARNTAMDAARGEYVYFMDSDDRIDPDYLEAMLSKARDTGCNILINTAVDIVRGGGKGRVSDNYTFVGPEGRYAARAVRNGFSTVVWARFYRKAFLEKTGVRSPALGGGVEDNFFVLLNECIGEGAYVFRGPFYHHIEREGCLSETSGNAFREMQVGRMIYDELVLRGLDPGKAGRLFNSNRKTELRNEEEYAFTRKFFTDASDAIREGIEDYPPAARLLFETVLSCPDYDAFRKECGPSFTLYCIRKTLMKK